MPTEPSNENTIELRFVLLRPEAKAPKRQSEFATGFDLSACLPDGAISLGPIPVRVPTGVAIAAPTGTDLQVRPRSGLFTRGVIGMLGTIDADYRGEIFVTLYCLPHVGTFVVNDGDRIGQLVIAPLASVSWSQVNELDVTDRGSDGHGSTGIR